MSWLVNVDHIKLVVAILSLIGSGVAAIRACQAHSKLKMLLKITYGDDEGPH